MSMKRTKKATSGRSSQAEGSLGFNPPASAVPKWDEVLADKADQAFSNYTPTRTFQRGDCVVHSKFGRGYVVAVEAGRAEILFEDGVKKLAHGQTP